MRASHTERKNRATIGYVAGVRWAVAGFFPDMKKWGVVPAVPPLACVRVDASPAAGQRIIRGRSRHPLAAGRGAIYNGIFPCFFFGFESTFVSSSVNARMSFGLVSDGSMTASIYPLLAAR
jgi:hypothetical protein